MSGNFTCTACGQEYLEFEEVESHRLWESPGPDRVQDRLHGFDALRERVTPMEPADVRKAGMVNGPTVDIPMELYPITMKEALYRHAQYQSNSHDGVTLLHGEPVVFDVEFPVEQPEPDATVCEYCHNAVFGGSDD